MGAAFFNWQTNQGNAVGFAIQAIGKYPEFFRNANL